MQATIVHRLCLSCDNYAPIALTLNAIVEDPFICLACTQSQIDADTEWEARNFPSDF